MRAVGSVLLVVTLAVFGAACDRGAQSQPPPPPEPEEIETCVDLADQMVRLTQEYVDIVGAQPVAGLLDPATTVPLLTQLDARGEALNERAAALGCTADQMQSLIVPGLAGLTAEGEIAQRYLELILEQAGVTDGDADPGGTTPP